ncbi:unnamed protein product [Ceutorhynchus assimilis]|uniref:G-protein coupled receptors family 1 profile domain-containing protein n=1 Tax=Ceutorhynchus assimilis TaxID=467358 RepID=A0A9N9QLQ5_9CUCU|nr:unnamed protein product [Ceutorhynchus assimilis]
MSTNATQSLGEDYNGTIVWFIVNVTLTAVTISGNLLTIAAIFFSRKLSSVVANQFIFSLAISDLFVGLTIPYHMTFYTINSEFGSSKTNCLLRFVLVSFACSSSITNLLVIASDRYAAIVYPLHYARVVTRKCSVVVVMVAWSVSFAVAAMPVKWNEWRAGAECEFFNVVPDDYLNFVLCPMFALIWCAMLLLYSRICREAKGQVERMRNGNGAQQFGLQLRDSKSFQVMLTILGCFTVCWLPLPSNHHLLPAQSRLAGNPLLRDRI